jgi:hypothetical protein
VTGKSQTLPWWLVGGRGKDDRKQNTFGPVGTTGRRVSLALPNLLCSNSFNIQAVVHLHPTYIADILSRFEAKPIHFKTCLLHNTTCGGLQKVMT